MSDEQLNRTDGTASAGMRRLFRLLARVTLCAALGTGFVVMGLRIIHLVHAGTLHWTLKSAVPLVLIGLSFICLQFGMERTSRERLLGLSVGSAFILWGAEQFMHDPEWIAAADDLVMLIFVLDLGMVIGGLLKGHRSSAPGG